MSGAVKITRALDPVRTGARWQQNFLFALSDKTTPQAAWAGCSAEVVLWPKSAPKAVEHAFRVPAEYVSVGASDALVQIDVPLSATKDFFPADYNIEINRIDDDDERHPGAIGSIPIQQGGSQIVDDEELLPSPQGAGAVGTVIITATGSTVATGTGPAGLGLREWKTISGAYTARPGDRLICDSSDAAFSVTLPAAGGDVWLRDLAGSFSAHTVTALGNGRTIGGDASLECDEAGFEVHLVSTPDAWGYTATYVYGEAA